MNSTVLFVPGLRDHVEEHWQTQLAREIPGARTVPPLETDKPSRAARVEALDQAVREIDGPVILVAHSAGALTVAHWAQTADRPVKGALLATPPNIDAPLPEGYPTPEQLQSNGWLPVPRTPLPFPTIVAASSDDPLASLGQVIELAHDWGGRLVAVGAVGHLNPASGFGPWPMGKRFIDELDGGTED